MTNRRNKKDPFVYASKYIVSIIVRKSTTSKSTPIKMFDYYHNAILWHRLIRRKVQLQSSLLSRCRAVANEWTSCKSYIYLSQNPDLRGSREKNVLARIWVPAGGSSSLCGQTMIYTQPFPVARPRRLPLSDGSVLEVGARDLQETGHVRIFQRIDT
jgi:hypothetical protein